MNFEECVEIVIKHEGGYVNDPDDRGGETMWGISSKTFPDIDMRTLTKNEAIEIYRSAFWENLKIQYMHPQVRLMIFDCAVNQGPARAGLFLQKACNINSDGIIGPLTIKAQAEFDPMYLVDSIARQRQEAYFKNTQFQKYGKGWLRRLLDITLISLRGK
jgi:lysozyme family protein